MSGKLQVTLRQSSESVRGTQKSDFTAAKSKKLMEEGLFEQDMSADMMPFPNCDRCFPAEEVFLFLRLMCVFCAYGIRGNK